ncbi:MAG: DUF11 domain-containing protein [Acidobacteriota bacterium]
MAAPILAQDASKLTHDGAIVPSPLGGPACTGFSDYEQPIDTANFNTARTSDVEAAFLTSEAFVSGSTITALTEGVAEGVRFWGISAEFNAGFLGPCTDDDTANTPFNIIFSEDNAGTPGAVIASVVGTPASITNTGIPFAFTTIFEWDVTIPPTDVTDAAWIGIQRQTGASTPGGNQCLFLWLDEINNATYDNTADQNAAPVPSDHVFCLNAPVPPMEADLAITKTGEVFGNQIVYTVTVTNNGPADAVNVVVTDMLPAEVTYVSDDCGALDVPPWTWNVGPLANGASAMCNITVDINPGTTGDVMNTAMVTADNADPLTADNSSTAIVGVGSVLEIPTLGTWGLLLLLVALGGAGLYIVRRG